MHLRAAPAAGGVLLTQVELTGTSALLSRIADLFRTITGGTYTRLEVDDPGRRIGRIDGGASRLSR